MFGLPTTQRTVVKNCLIWKFENDSFRVNAENLLSLSRCIYGGLKENCPIKECKFSEMWLYWGRCDLVEEVCHCVGGL